MKGVHMLSKNVDLNNTVILVTGAAGFVGANLVMSLLSEAEGTQIIGIDSVNDYYDVALKEYNAQKLTYDSKVAEKAAADAANAKSEADYQRQ